MLGPCGFLPGLIFLTAILNLSIEQAEVRYHRKLPAPFAHICQNAVLVGLKRDPPARPGQPAARVGPFQLSGPAPASTRKKMVATVSRGKASTPNNIHPLSRA